MTKRAKIKPCPFCGAKAAYSDEMGAILCEGCGFYFECPTTLEQSLETWNMREGQIITPKRKARLVKVRAWTTRGLNGKPYGIMYENPSKHNVYDSGKWFPVTILIDKKYLREGK